MKVFATRVWGFDPANWPVINFGLAGNRSKLLNESAAGDRIVFVATQSPPTAESDRGRLLGMAEIGREPVDTLDVLRPDVPRPEDYDDAGRFRWPKGLLMIRAWAFDPSPLLRDVLAAQLPYNATPQAVMLSERDAAAVLSLTRKEIAIPESPAQERARLLDAALRANRPTTGPRPVAWQGETNRTTDQPAVTYALRFGDSDIWKIGHAVDLEKRVKEINWHIPNEIIADAWGPALQQKWPNQESAFAMEQRVLGRLSERRTRAELLRCPKSELERAWTRAIGIGI